MSPNDLRRRKIAVLGSRSVGKSSLILQYIQGQFFESYYPTIESTFSKTITYNGAEWDCEIIDTAGQDEYSILNAKHSIGIHGYVLVYSISSQNSFDMIQIIIDKITAFCGVSDIPCVIVGSKLDLESARQVSTARGQELADHNGCAFVETSAKSNQHVAEVFERCIEQIQKRAPQTGGTEPSTSKCLIM